MKYQRARRVVGERSDPLASKAGDGEAPTRARLAHRGAKSSAPPSPELTVPVSQSPMRSQALDSPEPMRKLVAPSFVTRRNNGGASKNDPLAPLFMQPRDFIHLKQKSMVRWRLNRWAQDLLEYTQAQRAAKARTSSLISATELIAPSPNSTSIPLDPKITTVPSLESQSLVLGFTLTDQSANTLKISE